MEAEKKMMVKGTGPMALNAFVKTKFPNRFEEWLAAIPPESRKTHQTSILAFELYPLYDSLAVPTEKVCDLFYNGDEHGAWETGIHSASYALSGFYKIFFKVGSPQFIIDRASRVFSNYYPEGVLRVEESSSRRCVLRIVKFPEPYRVVELSIAGWVEGALALMGKRERCVEVTRWMSSGAPATEIIATW